MTTTFPYGLTTEELVLESGWTPEASEGNDRVHAELPNAARERVDRSIEILSDRYPGRDDEILYTALVWELG